MKPVSKTQAQITSEQQEAALLRQRILTATDSIPPRVLAGSQQTAVAFKEAAIKARKIAESAANRNNLAKLRDAWISISGYYGGQS